MFQGGFIHQWAFMSLLAKSWRDVYEGPKDRPTQVAKGAGRAFSFSSVLKNACLSGVDGSDQFYP